MKKQNSDSFFKKLFLVFVMFIIIPLLLLYFSSANMFIIDTRQKLTTFSEEKVRLLKDVIEAHTLGIERNIDSIYYKKTFHNMLIKYNRTAKNTSMEEYKLKYELESILHSLDEVESIIYVDNYQNYMSVGINAKTEMALKNLTIAEMEETQGQLVWKYYNVSGKNKIAIGREFNIINENNQKVKLGYLIFIIDEKRIFNDYEEYIDESNSSFYIFCKGNYVMSSSMRSEIGFNYDQLGIKKLQSNLIEKDKETFIYMQNSMTSTGWNLVFLIKDDSIRTNVLRMLILLGIITLLCTIVAIAVSFFFSKNISNALVGLLKGMDEVQKGNFNIRVSTKKRDEIGMLYDRFNHMTENLADSIEKNISLNVKMKDIQTITYEAQMNPHFMYNTLEMIGMLAALGENTKIEESVVYLSEVLRFNLREEKQVTIGDEIQNIENYLKIIKLRFCDDFEYSINVEQSLLNCHTLKFLLQPCVENCVKHGFSQILGVGIIKIAVKRLGNEIVFIIKDNGIGMDEEKVARLKESLENEDINNRFNIGMRNVHQRIRLVYGELYGIDIKSEPNKGTYIFIRIPVDSQKGEADV